ncbi:MAG: ribosome maturation factor RimM [Proteobacteria bacterium]|nr:ribosome maturation factor RimM [Pseudomonadota bacterium]
MPEEKAAQESKVCLGVISGAHGIRGEVKIKAFGEDPLAIGAYGPLSGETGGTTVEITTVRPNKGGVIARIKGIEDRTQAEALKGLKLYVERSALPDAAEDEYYHADLVGLSVELSDGKPMGKVIAVQDFGAGPMLEIRLSGPAQTGAKAGTKAENTLLAPFTREIVPEVDLAGGRLVLDPPPGLLEGPKPAKRGHGRGGPT